MGKKRANERGGATPRTAATEEPNVDRRTKQASPLVGATPGPSPPYVAGDPSIAGEGWVRVRVSADARQRSIDLPKFQVKIHRSDLIPITAYNTRWITNASAATLKLATEKTRAVNGRRW